MFLGIYIFGIVNPLAIFFLLSCFEVFLILTLPGFPNKKASISLIKSSNGESLSPGKNLSNKLEPKIEELFKFYSINPEAVTIGGGLSIK